MKVRAISENETNSEQLMEMKQTQNLERNRHFILDFPGFANMDKAYPNNINSLANFSIFLKSMI